MRNIYRTIVRLERLRYKNRYSPTRNKQLFYPNRVFYSQTFRQEIAGMGKDKVPYQLKTPKGTKDCRCLFSVHRIDRR